MNIRSRRITYLIFIIIFLIITPVVILYAAGYRYNFQKHKLQKTGILILKSKPEGANIFLNGELQKSTTPARFTNLIPEDYSIKVEKENFYFWQKTLPVRSRLTTFAENITLFKKNLPIELSPGDVPLFSLSPDKEKIAYLSTDGTEKQVWLLHNKTGEKTMLYGTTTKEEAIVKKIEWSRSGQKILITVSENSHPEKYIVFDYQTETASTYKNLDEFYFDFAGIKKKSLEISANNDLALLQNSSNLLAILDKKNHDLKIWNTDNDRLVFETESDDAAWSRDGNKILYVKNFEIWFYNFSADQETLVTRYSKEIKKIGWINDNYIIVLFDNNLRAIELDERDQRNVTDLLSLDDLRDFDLDQGEQKIYFIGSVENKKGVFELPY